METICPPAPLGPSLRFSIHTFCDNFVVLCGKSTGRKGIVGSVSERDAEIVRRVWAGEKLGPVADSLDLTRERVRQVFLRETGMPVSEVRREQAWARVEPFLESWFYAKRRWDPGKPWLERMGVDANRLRELLVWRGDPRLVAAFDEVRGYPVSPNNYPWGERRCVECREWAPLEAYGEMRSGGVQGRNIRCKACNRAGALRNYRKLKVERSGVDPSSERRCACCRVVKPRGDFYLGRVRADGLQTYCKACQGRMRSGERVADIRAEVIA